MSDVRPDLVETWRKTQSVYQREAAGWDRRRPRLLFERTWLERFLALVKRGGHVLDLGCGAGEPIGEFILSGGYSLTGVDSASAMIDLSRARFPQATWRVQDMRTLQVRGPFDGVLSWDGSFHLGREEQKALICSLAPLMVSGAPLMLTVGPEDGEVTGTVEGATVYHASLSERGYRETLEAAGFELLEFVREDETCDFHSILFAVKS